MASTHELARFSSLLEPDILLIQEIDRRALRSRREDQFEILREKTGLKDAYFLRTVAFGSGGEYGHAIFAKPGLIQEVSAINLSISGDPEARLALCARVELNNQSFELYGVHNSAKRTIAIAQMELLLAHINNERFVVAGDFNLRNADLTKLGFEDLDFEPTCGLPLRNKRLDHIVGRGVELKDRQTHPSGTLSDHDAISAAINFSK